MGIDIEKEEVMIGVSLLNIVENHFHLPLESEDEYPPFYFFPLFFNANQFCQAK